jgi:ubiquinol-cytochrome c reductase iron-sulfur subunit
MSDELRRLRQRRATHRAAAVFGLSVLGSALFVAGYVTDGLALQGIGFAVAFAAIAYGLATWARYLLPHGGFVEHRRPMASPREQRLLLSSSLHEVPPAGSRRGLMYLLGLAVGGLGLAAIVPLRSLLAPGSADPLHALRHTAWQAKGLRLVRPDGGFVTAAEVPPGAVVVVQPEGYPAAGDTPAFLVRVDPARAVTPAGHVDGVIAYSLLCTHAGCPVPLYEEGTGRMLCPCHQSAFDLWSGARPVSGPAARALPALPIAADADGRLFATGDFTAPPGPGFWSEP